MQVAIIGSGNVGTALASSAVKAGHHVTITATSKSKADEAARASGAHAGRCNVEAVQGSDLVVLAVPAAKVDEVVGELSSDLDGKVIIDVTNRVNPQNPAAVLDGTSTAERIQVRLPKAHVVKAFNYAFAVRMANPRVEGMDIDGYVAGDDEAAKSTALEFVQSLGLRPIDAGPLAMARVLEGMGMLIVLLQIKHRWPWQSAWKLIGPTGQKQD